VAIDTNVLAYAEGVNGASRRNAALDLIERLPPETTFVPVQVMGELFHVLVRKVKWQPEKARKSILDWRDAFGLIETSAAVLFAAAELSSHHDVGICDAVILSAASAADCRVLLSEDMQAGFTWSGVTIVNPFAETKHPLLLDLLGA
jgi:predicted nucleic acid-binding protein